ncbi:MAG: LytR/AlgR family response regulator transcription factor [Coprobacillaceae bacterium]
MGKIIILDDDKQFSEILKEKVKPFFKENEEIVIFEDFHKEYFETNEIELVFLDIEMGVVNGIDVAKEIRLVKNNPIIIFVSSKEGLIHNTLEVQPLYFIRKTKLDEDIKSAFSLLRTVNFRGDDTIEVGGVIIKINDILYIESSDHKITFQLKDDKFTCRGTLESMEKQLEEYHFVRSHRSFVLNVRQVDRHYRSKVILKTGEKIDIGRKYQEAIKAKYREVRLSGII